MVKHRLDYSDDVSFFMIIELRLNPMKGKLLSAVVSSFPSKYRTSICSFSSVFQVDANMSNFITHGKSCSIARLSKEDLGSSSMFSSKLRQRTEKIAKDMPPNCSFSFYETFFLNKILSAKNRKTDFK